MLQASAAAAGVRRPLVACWRRRVAALLATVTVAAVPAHAGAAQIGVSPPIVRLEGRAGETLTQPITVEAGEEDPITVELVHADFGFEDTSYEVTLIFDDAAETTAFSTRGWFSLPRERYRIPAGRSRKLPLRIRIPRNTPGGTYLGAALLRVVPPRTRDGASQVQAVPQTGPLVFVAVEGGDPPRPRLREFEVPRFVAKGPIRPRITIENRGDEFFTYEGTLRLRGPGRDDVQEISTQFVVPGQPRRVRTSADERGESGAPRLGRRSLGFGRYRVTARLRIDPTGTTIRETRTVWVVPTWVRVTASVLAVVLALCLALLIAWVMRREPGVAHDGLADATGGLHEEDDHLEEPGGSDGDLDDHDEEPLEQDADYDDEDEDVDEDPDDGDWRA